MAVTLLGTLGAAAQPQPIELTPDWDRGFQQGVEWCRPVGGEPASALLLCTKDSRLDLIELETGRSRLDDALPVQPGTRFAGARGGIAYCHGVSRIYALRVASSGEAENAWPGLLWQVAAAPREHADGDPEFMTRIVAARATPGGVLIVRSDGQIAELLRDDGCIRWQDRLPETAECKLLVREATAALIGKSGDALSVGFLDLSSARPRLRLTRVEQPPPIWSGLISDGLLAVWQKRFALISPDGRTAIVELPAGVSATAAAVAVFEPAALSVGEHRARALLLAGSAAGLVCAYDFASREWNRPKREVNATSEVAKPLSSMWLCGDHLLRASRGSLTVYDAATCEYLTGLRHGRWVIDGATRDRVAYGLFAERQSSRNAGPVRLIRQALAEESRPRTDERLAFESQHFLLGSATLVLDTLWLGDTLVIVEDKRVRAYTLP